MAVDKIGINSTTNVSGNITSKQKPAEKKPISKAVIGATLIGLAALASVGIYIATKGKGKCSVKPQDLKENNPVNKFENIINEFKSTHTNYADAKPKITTLKNGKTKIEFENFDKDMSQRQNNMLVLDKDGKLEKRICFNTFEDSYGKVGLNQYFVYDGMKDSSKVIKSYNSSIREGAEGGFNIKQHNISVKKAAENQPDGTYWHKHINTRRSDNYAYVENFAESIPYKETRGNNIKTVAHIGADKKPDIVRQSVSSPNPGGERKSFVFKPAQTPLKAESKKNPFVNPKDYASLDEAMEKDESFIIEYAKIS